MENHTHPRGFYRRCVKNRSFDKNIFHIFPAALRKPDEKRKAVFAFFKSHERKPKKMKIYFHKLTPDAVIPSRATAESAGFDLSVCSETPVTIEPGKTVLVHTGVAVVLPMGTAGMVYPRSGLASKHGIDLANCVGVIDSDYRGELMVPLHNHSDQPFTVSGGDRIAQMVVTPVILPEVEEIPIDEPMPESERGEGGFGSTGLKNGNTENAESAESKA